MSNHDGGIKIFNQRFNIFCYADDILLVSTTKSGLQNLINTAVKYVDEHGLRFNPSKTVSLVKGDNPFVFTPKFYIKNCELRINDSIVFHGATLGNKANNIHVDNRISACRKAFYSLQGAGLCKNGLSLETAMNVFSATSKSTLLYACESLQLNKSNMSELDKTQGNLMKAIVGIGKRYHTSPLLQALECPAISSTIELNSVRLFSNIMKHSSAARNFYTLMFKKKCKCVKLLNNRASLICKNYNLNMYKTLSDKGYLNKVKSAILKRVKSDGVVDRIKALLRNRTAYSTNLVRLLLRAF